MGPALEDLLAVASSSFEFDIHADTKEPEKRRGSACGVHMAAWCLLHAVGCLDLPLPLPPAGTCMPRAARPAGQRAERTATTHPTPACCCAGRGQHRGVQRQRLGAGHVQQLRHAAGRLAAARARGLRVVPDLQVATHHGAGHWVGGRTLPSAAWRGSGMTACRCGGVMGVALCGARWPGHQAAHGGVGGRQRGWRSPQRVCPCLLASPAPPPVIKDVTGVLACPPPPGPPPYRHAADGMPARRCRLAPRRARCSAAQTSQGRRAGRHSTTTGTFSAALLLQMRQLGFRHAGWS